jgi:hypothetical protein
MELRDWELLDKQVWGLRPPRNNRVTVLTVVAVFFAGMTLGGILFAHESKRCESRRTIRLLRWPATTTVLAAFDLIRRRPAL